MAKSNQTILIDIDAAGTASKSGVGYYSVNLLEALAINAPENTQIVAHYFNFLGKNKPNLPNHTNIAYKQSRLIPRQAANLLRRLNIPFPYELLTRTRANFIIFPNFLRRSTLYKTPYAAAIHDLTYIDLPEYVTTKNRQDLLKFVPKTLDGAAFIIALSQTMADKITKQYPSYKNPILAELLPVEKPRKLPAATTQKILAELGLQKKYILFMGNLEPRKNLSNLIAAYQLLPDALQQEYALVLAGGAGWNNTKIMDDIKQAQEAGTDILASGYVTDEQRAALYSSASLFAFVSSYEGYGMPALEAMSYSVPVLASDIPVLREVCGAAAVFCDPEDTRSIANTMEKVLMDKSLRKDIISKGAVNVAAKSWGDIAQKIFVNIDDVLRNNQ
jgi:glycosyltransferase involved in cell wall biosynthesis